MFSHDVFIVIIYFINYDHVVRDNWKQAEDKRDLKSENLV